MQSLKHHVISKFPDHLIISIKRFEYDTALKCNRKQPAKIGINQILAVRGVGYQTASIIVHRVPLS